jgi:hypothetical protein
MSKKNKRPNPSEDLVYGFLVDGIDASDKIRYVTESMEILKNERPKRVCGYMDSFIQKFELIHDEADKEFISELFFTIALYIEPYVQKLIPASDHKDKVMALLETAITDYRVTRNARSFVTTVKSEVAKLFEETEGNVKSIKIEQLKI